MKQMILIFFLFGGFFIAPSDSGLLAYSGGDATINTDNAGGSQNNNSSSMIQFRLMNEPDHVLSDQNTIYIPSSQGLTIEAPSQQSQIEACTHVAILTDGDVKLRTSVVRANSHPGSLAVFGKSFVIDEYATPLGRVGESFQSLHDQGVSLANTISFDTTALYAIGSSAGQSGSYGSSEGDFRVHPNLVQMSGNQGDFYSGPVITGNIHPVGERDGASINGFASRNSMACVDFSQNAALSAAIQNIDSLQWNMMSIKISD